MPTFNSGDVSIDYIDEGTGHPVFILAPGGMRSEVSFWDAMPWNPISHLSGSYRVIAMDQRNAGASTAPISADDGWDDYADDQIGLLDHLGIDSCHLLGMCIGGPFIAALLAREADRFDSAVMLQPASITDSNRIDFNDNFDTWAAPLANSHVEAAATDWVSFRENMWGGDFMLTAQPEDFESITTPLLVLMGNDHFHPEETSREVVRRAPNATLIEEWKGEDALGDTDRSIKHFLAEHSPT